MLITTINQRTVKSSFSEGGLSGSSETALRATLIDLPVAVGSKSKTARTIFPIEKMSLFARQNTQRLPFVQLLGIFAESAFFGSLGRGYLCFK